VKVEIEMVVNNTSKVKYLLRYKRKPNIVREKEKNRNKGNEEK
jgi:hypothetical protein